MERTSKLIVGQEQRDPPVEINVGSRVYAVTFSANGKYLLSGGEGGVQVWQVENGTQVARMEARGVVCLAASKDSRWIAAGTGWGELFVWDAKTHKQVFNFKYKEDYQRIKGVDFSPDSTRLVTASDNRTSSVWDIPTGKRVQTLYHHHSVRAAKYLPHGDRIATATEHSIHVWDSKDGHLLVDIEVGVTPWYNTGLLWSNDRLFTISDRKFKEIDAFTGLVVSEWPVADSNEVSSISLPQQGEFIAYSAKRSITFWDTSSHTKFAHIQLPRDIRSFALSPNGNFIAIGEDKGNINVKRLHHIIVSALSLWMTVYMNNFLVPIIQSLSLVYTPGTRHSDKRRCTRCLEAQSTRKRRSIVERSHPRLSKSKSSCTCWSSSRPGTLTEMGRSDHRCQKGFHRSALLHAKADDTLTSSPSPFSHPSSVTLQRV